MLFLYGCAIQSGESVLFDDMDPQVQYAGLAVLRYQKNTKTQNKKKNHTKNHFFIFLKLNP